MPQFRAVSRQTVNPVIAEQEPERAVGKAGDVIGVRMMSASADVLTEEDASVVVKQGEAEEDLVAFVTVDVRDSRVAPSKVTTGNPVRTRRRSSVCGPGSTG
jgi:hypothetical protein